MCIRDRSNPNLCNIPMIASIVGPTTKTSTKVPTLSCFLSAMKIAITKVTSIIILAVPVETLRAFESPWVNTVNGSDPAPQMCIRDRS